MKDLLKFFENRRVSAATGTENIPECQNCVRNKNDSQRKNEGAPQADTGESDNDYHFWMLKNFHTESRGFDHFISHSRWLVFSN
jgi:hypothetical protein